MPRAGSAGLGDVGHGVDAAGRHAAAFQGREHLVHAAWRGPGADGGVDLGHARHAPGVVGQCRVGPRSSRPMRAISRLKMLSPLPAISA
jgi:hypothetical protein